MLLKNGSGWKFENIGKNQRINMKYVSANPTGPLHAGHARGAVYGDALASILKNVGFKVVKEYYINDGGNQIEALLKSSFLRYLEALGDKNIQIPNGLYPGDYLKPVGVMLKSKFEKKLKNLPFNEYSLL